MTTESKAAITPVERTAVELNPTGTSDETKTITDGCGKLIIWDNTLNGNAVTVTLSTKADVYGRSTDPGTYNPITIGAGKMYVGGPYSAALYGQGTSLTDLTYTIACAAGGKLAVPSGLAGVQSTGGSLANGDYDYKITAVNGNDLETDACAKIDVNVAAGGGTASVVLTWDKVLGACAFRIYGRTDAATLHLLHTVVSDPHEAGQKLTWTDTGAIAESAIESPGANAASDSKNFFYHFAIHPAQSSS